LIVSIVAQAIFLQQELSSCWNGRLFGHNRHGPKSRGSCCAPFRGWGCWVPI